MEEKKEIDLIAVVNKITKFNLPVNEEQFIEYVLDAIQKDKIEMVHINFYENGMEIKDDNVIGTFKIEPSKGHMGLEVKLDSDYMEYQPYLKKLSLKIGTLMNPFAELSSLMDSLKETFGGSAGKGIESVPLPTSESEKEHYIEQVRSKLDIADIYTKKDIKLTLKDYIAEKELKEELEEIASFFTHREEYLRAGVEIPKGILFKGPPGTGKTHAAKCISGSTDTIFVTTTASALQGMYIGSGAERVRKLFKAARQLNKVAPVIIFIDEVDSIGQNRMQGQSSHGEENRTLNQLLAELSGFNERDNIMLICATNLSEVLDSALVRSGRISRHINIEYPNEAARKRLLEYYLKSKSLYKDVDIDQLVKSTPSFTPADIKELVNEAAILSVREKKAEVDMDCLDFAINKTITKSIKKDHNVDYYHIAVHEIGHVMGYKMYKKLIPIKVTNYSYGNALGFTQSSEEPKVLNYKEDLMNEVKVLLAGRAAEEVILNKITTGASDDLRRAKNTLKNYYEQYNFEVYEEKDLKQIILDEVHKVYNEVVSDFRQEDTKNLIKVLSDELKSKRILRQRDLKSYLKKTALDEEVNLLDVEERW